MDEIVKFLKTLGVGLRPTNDPFLNNTYEVCKVFERFGVTVEDEEELCHEIMKEFRCNACNDTFQNLLDYELHYHNSHHFICTECKKWRPTARLLEIHVQEMHDSFFKILADKQPMYKCLVSGCAMKFKDSIERKEHCIETHAFPKNYRFYFNHDNTNEKHKKITQSDSAMEVDEKKQCDKKEQKLYFTNSKQKTFKKQKFNINIGSTIEEPKIESTFKPVTMFIPRQVQQKSYAKKLTQNKGMETEVLESGSLMELTDSLSNI
ncbi:zinc finger protein 511 [Phymastichus coffea]|uniref:zinc finger protein 511 n=1 Tax=Phymastichus coffea TaxID=108790 RepID=UPI00273CA432|nr:zinc finger protein 511 [Phymastichus coffea]XP_058792596.1 zinc finger protein 511 [Phymastichus coffea]